MTVGIAHTNWQTHLPAPDSRYDYCSPNIVAICDELGKRWSMGYNGCYGWRTVRAGTSPSSHGFGAAEDRKYDSVGRAVAVAEILPFLIDHSEELHLSAIHDYLACRIWHSGRTADRADAHTLWWKAQTPSTANGMGQSWATYFHIETTEAGWDDGTPVPNRPGIAFPTPVPQPVPMPIPTPVPQPSPPSTGGFVHPTIRKGDTGEAVFTLQFALRKLAGNTNIIADGQFGTVTETGLRGFQSWFGLTADGVAGPKTWDKVNALVNS